ncbi:DNA methyltransferase [Lonepinella sp. BR2904]|uniref:DNA methyltransferase n=1 Tax=Lonepinella sp. BR2904 TaxID=3434551 RepID=UPI003F6E15B6
MALNPTEIYENLEKLVKKNLTRVPKIENDGNGTERNGTERNGTERNSLFIFDFLQIFSIPKSTITKLKNNTSNTNKALNPEFGEVAFIRQIYFKPIFDNANLFNELENLKNADIITTHKIRFIFITDFINIEAYDIKAQEQLSIPFAELYQNYDFFLPIAGFEKAILTAENPADTKAAYQMGKLFDAIKNNNELDQHTLNIFLTRLLFCFFAEDTNIFEKQSFTALIKNHTDEQGSQLSELLNDCFHILNLDENDTKRQTYPAFLQRLPYVNGGLFAEQYQIPEFNAKSRRLLLNCAQLDWSEINPDIFGSMFQSVIDPKQRAELGQHYTSVKNIMKVIKPLFLEPLYQELDKLKVLVQSPERDKKLTALLQRISDIKIFDPACGSGNFLIIAYKELRKLEIEIMKNFSQTKSMFSGIHLDHFYGLEIDDFACETARLSLYLAEHQMHQQMADELGIRAPTLPLKNIKSIKCCNSLRENWEVFCPRKNRENDEVYIIGNPPFGGKQGRTLDQTLDIKLVFGDINKNIDYVTNWFMKGAKYIRDSVSEVAFVATSSICQGEQVPILWKRIFALNVSIKFAYRSFIWKNSARENAAVHTIIIGLSSQNNDKKIIYDEINNKLLSENVENISPYIINGKNIYIESRRDNISEISEIYSGSMPNDGGFLLLDEKEKKELLQKDPNVKKYIRKFLGADEFIKNKQRYCLWLVNEKNVMNIESIVNRILGVKNSRSSSPREATRSLAKTPHLFGEIRQPVSGEYILIPSTSSENREYIPIGFINSDVISSNANLIVPNATLYEFGILASEMHNDFMRVVAGRLESRYRYSAKVIYNNFPFPDVTEKQKAEISKLSQEILLVREDYPDKNLAYLYDPDTMPEPLKQAHQTLDKAVEKLYRDKPFKDSSERVEFLFERYEQLVKNLQKGTKK